MNAEHSLKIGLVGTGFMGRMHGAVYGLLPNAELVSVFDTSSTRAAEVAGPQSAKIEQSFDAMLDDKSLDAIDICLPTYLHCEYTVKALAAGKHVMCEKPMALSLAEADQMIAAAESAGKKLMIGHCIRHWPEYAHLKKLADGGSLGKLLSINLTRYGEFPSWGSNNWLADEAMAGGGALDMHIHDTDYALYLFGEPKHVFSAGTIDEKGVSQIFTTFTYNDGSVAHLEGGWNLPPGTPFKMAFRAIFEKGAAIMDAGPYTIYRQDAAPEVPEFPKMSNAGGGNISDLGGYYFELADFVNKVLNDEPFEVVTPQSSRQSLEYALREIELVKM